MDSFHSCQRDGVYWEGVQGWHYQDTQGSKRWWWSMLRKKWWVSGVIMPLSKCFAYVWQHACTDIYTAACVKLGFSDSVQFGFRQKEVSLMPLLFASYVFSKGLRVFSVEIVINLLCADESNRAGNIKTCREKSPWIIRNPVWMFHYIAAERLSHSQSRFTASVSPILCSGVFLSLFSLFLCLSFFLTFLRRLLFL